MLYFDGCGGGDLQPIVGGLDAPARRVRQESTSAASEFFSSQPVEIDGRFWTISISGRLSLLVVVSIREIKLRLFITQLIHLHNKKHLKNVGPIRHCEPSHVHSPGVASGTVARRLRIDVHDNNDNDNA